jgi:hypothetical protein
MRTPCVTTNENYVFISIKNVKSPLVLETRINYECKHIIANRGLRVGFQKDLNIIDWKKRHDIGKGADC